MRVLLAVVIGLLFAAPAAAAPRLIVGGTLWRADGAVVGNDPLTVEPVAPGARVAVTVDGAPLSGTRVDPRRYGDGPHRVVVTATDATGVSTDQVEVTFTHASPEPRRALAVRGGGTSAPVANLGDVDGDGGEDVLLGNRLALHNGRDVRLEGAAITAVAAAGDVNGDGYRDLLLASRTRVYAVFGGPWLRSLWLPALGRRGLTIRRGASSVATRRLGDFAVDGDLDGDGLDDIVFVSAGQVLVASGRRSGGVVGARVRFSGAGAVSLPGDIDHDGRGEMLAVSPNVATVLYASGGDSRVLGSGFTTAGSIGDVDADSTPDLLIGGTRSVVVFAQPGVDVDVSGPFPGFAIAGPGPAVSVAGAGDLDGDYAPDVVLGFATDAWLVYSPLDEPAVDLASAPGDRATRFPGAGGPVDGLDEDAVIVGGTRVALPPRGCVPNVLWSFPYSAEHVLPPCRRANRVVDSPAFSPSEDAGQIARFNPEPACGPPSRTCRPTAYRSGNARLHGNGIGLTTTGIVDLVDSYGNRLAAIQQTAPGCFAVFDRALAPVGNTCDPVGDPPASHPTDLWIQGRACMATPALEDTHYLVRLLDPRGDPAAAYRELQGFIRRDQMTLGPATPDADPAALAEAAYTGCGPRPPKRAPVPVRFAPTFPGLPRGERLFGFADRYVSNASFEDCEGSFPPDLNPACYGPYMNYQVPTLASKDPQLPTGDPRAGADWAALTVSTTGASGAGYPAHPVDGEDVESAGGGLVRAIVPRDRAFTVLDGFSYSDPNVPCDTPRVARWLYGAARPRSGERAIYGWTVFRDPQGVRARNGLSPGCP